MEKEIIEKEELVEDFEKVIIKAIFHNPAVRNKVIPMINIQWFRGNQEMTRIVETIIDFNDKYEVMPQPIEMRRMLKDDKTIEYFNASLKLPDETITDFILEEIQEFIKRKLIWNTAQDMLKFCQTPNDKQPDSDFVDRTSDAESFSFDESVGLDYLEEMDRIYDEAIKNEVLVKTGLRTLDSMLMGGFHEKTLSLILSPTNVGKTLIMCSLATNILRLGKNVLYITFEDSELKIGARVTQNLCDVTQEQLKLMSKEDYIKCKEKFKNAISSQLIIKEFPEGAINALAIKSLLKELREKKKFIPEIIFIDYIGCMVPNGRDNPNLNSNSIILKVAAQVRAISMEYGMPIVSAAQTNRDGFDSSTVKLSNTADSIGQTMKADFILGVAQTAEMKNQNLYSWEVNKTRFGNNKNDSYTVRVDIAKQRILDMGGAETPVVSPMGIGEAININAGNSMGKMLNDNWS